MRRKIFEGLMIIFLGVFIWGTLTDLIFSYDAKPAVATSDTNSGQSGLTLVAVGDVVMHMPIIQSVFNPGDGSYDFRPIFAEIKPDLTAADIAVAVLENPIAGAERQYSGYPAFNCPSSIADAMKWAGIDLVFDAHNHSLDRGFDGLQAGLLYLDQIGLPYVGCNKDVNQKRYRLFEVKGVKLAFLSYTTTTNGIKLPIGEEWAVNLFDQQKIREDISAVKQAGADCIIMALHTGTEYQRIPSPEQHELIDWLIRSGVDIVLGSHVHVIQPLEEKKFSDPVTGKIRDYFVAYSLGNLLSNQRWRYSDCGLMVKIVLQKELGRSGVRIVKTSYTPLWINLYSEGGKMQYRIKEVNGPGDYGIDPNLDQLGRVRMKEVWLEIKELLNDWTKWGVDRFGRSGFPEQ